MLPPGARIVRRAQDQTLPEYIRPGTISSERAVTPAASEVHRYVRWDRGDMGTGAVMRKGFQGLAAPLLNV